MITNHVVVDHLILDHLVSNQTPENLAQTGSEKKVELTEQLQEFTGGLSRTRHRRALP